MKKNKNGFTLVELMAVLIILIIIIFLAISKVNKSVDESENKTIVANAGVYVKAVNDFMSVESLNNPNYLNGNYTVSKLKEIGVKVSGTKPDNGYVYVVNADVTFSCLEYGEKYIVYSGGKTSEPDEGTCPKSNDYTYSYTGKAKTFEAPVSAYYKIELWGAQGVNYNADTPGGKGAYTSGIIFLNQGEKLYVYVGATGSSKTGGYNGGANGGTQTDGTYYGGGGATDVRLENVVLTLKNGTTRNYNPIGLGVNWNGVGLPSGDVNLYEGNSYDLKCTFKLPAPVTHITGDLVVDTTSDKNMICGHVDSDIVSEK